MHTLNADYNPAELEKRWQAIWEKENLYHTPASSSKPKYYVLDMFPYPSGAGLHVGHPLGYIASDIFARFKRLQGYNVLHPMGFDAFGLPAEQYAIQTGQHPAITTEANITRYKEQLGQLGFSYDWSREVNTSKEDYYKWTQWIFIELFHHWYNNAAQKARPIAELEAHFAQYGNAGLQAAADEDTPAITAGQWLAFSAAEKEEYLQHYRLAFTSEAYVNWCPALGTVLANDEVKDGFSERGGYPVERKLMRQFMLRISAYADRLLDGLDTIDWLESIKEQQRNWIGRSTGALVDFYVDGYAEPLTVFTTRPDTLYGVTFMVLAPEHPMVPNLTTAAMKAEVEAYVLETSRRSELDRKADVKRVTGVVTGSYAKHPLNGAPVQIWIADYVLAGYGTGAVMAVPSSDTRDFAFASHFELEIIQVQTGPHTDITAEDFDPKAGTMINSPDLNGLEVYPAIEKAIEILEAKGLGKRKTQYRMRDAVFGRQRYWGEPIPVYYENGVPKTLPVSELPLVLPAVDKFLPTEEGEPPLARAKDWHYKKNDQDLGHPLETTTMPGWAGSSWYFLRYMDPQNNGSFAAKEALDYWGQVDLYVGGSEHATGHLLYSRFWNKFLKDLGLVQHEEPFKKLVNQGMIMGVSEKIIRIDGHILIASNSDEITNDGTTVFFESHGRFNSSNRNNLPHSLMNVEVSMVKNGLLSIRELLKSNAVSSFENGTFRFEDRKTHSLNQLREFSISNDPFLLDRIDSLEMQTIQEVEKMSKSKLNTVNPDDIVAKYGADTLRLYEMFLGPLEQSKPWSTSGIEGVAKFLRRFYRLFISDKGHSLITDAAPTADELRILHKTLQKVAEDIEKLSFNTIIPAFMIACNELTDAKCHKRAILEPLCIALAPLAPYITEELWHGMGNSVSIHAQDYPEVKPEYLVKDSVLYPVSFNGKTRVKLDLPADFTQNQVEEAVLADADVQKYLAGATPKKVIVVPGRMVNLVI